MIKNVEVKEGLLQYFKQEYEALSGQVPKSSPKFGDWCTYDRNVFCQEREGCNNCVKRQE
jgi:hypothetical protein